jgi:hypothetical protein
LSFGAGPQLAAAGAASIPATESAQLASSCPSVIFLGARGSGETATPTLDGEGPNVYAMSREIKSYLDARHQTFKSFGITDGYRADPISDLEPSKAEIAELVIGVDHFWSSYKQNNIDPFFASIATGVIATKQELTDWVRSCPASQIILAGYSQGAMAVHEAEDQLRSVGSTLLSHVVATILLADGDEVEYSEPPQYKPKEYGTALDPEGVLVFAEDNGLWPGDWSEVPRPLLTVSICAQYDLVCDFKSAVSHWIADAKAAYKSQGLKAAEQSVSADIARSAAIHTEYTVHTDASVGAAIPSLTNAVQWAETLISDFPTSFSATATLGHMDDLIFSGSPVPHQRCQFAPLQGLATAQGHYTCEYDVTDASGYIQGITPGGGSWISCGEIVDLALFRPPSFFSLSLGRDGGGALTFWAATKKTCFGALDWLSSDHDLPPSRYSQQALTAGWKPGDASSRWELYSYESATGAPVADVRVPLQVTWQY